LRQRGRRGRTLGLKEGRRKGPFRNVKITCLSTFAKKVEEFLDDEKIRNRVEQTAGPVPPQAAKTRQLNHRRGEKESQTTTGGKRYIQTR